MPKNRTPPDDRHIADPSIRATLAFLDREVGRLQQMVGDLNGMASCSFFDQRDAATLAAHVANRDRLAAAAGNIRAYFRAAKPPHDAMTDTEAKRWLLSPLRAGSEPLESRVDCNSEGVSVETVKP